MPPHPKTPAPNLRDNDNGLIDIRSLAQLNAVRRDLDGNERAPLRQPGKLRGSFSPPDHPNELLPPVRRLRPARQSGL